jgi:hypothetical protein
MRGARVAAFRSSQSEGQHRRHEYRSIVEQEDGWRRRRWARR